MLFSTLGAWRQEHPTLAFAPKSQCREKLTAGWDSAGDLGLQGRSLPCLCSESFQHPGVLDRGWATSGGGFSLCGSLGALQGPDSSAWNAFVPSGPPSLDLGLPSPPFWILPFRYNCPWHEQPASILPYRRRQHDIVAKGYIFREHRLSSNVGSDTHCVR